MAMKELVELFLNDNTGTPGNSFHATNDLNFGIEFTKFMRQNYAFKARTNGNFFPVFFISSLLTLPCSQLLDRNLIIEVNFKLDSENVIKVVYPRIAEDNTIVFEFRTVLFGGDTVIDSPYRRLKDEHGFTNDEVREIFDHYHLTADLLSGIKFRSKVLQITKNLDILWTELNCDFIREKFQSITNTAHTDLSSIQTFIRLKRAEPSYEALLLEPFTFLNGATTPDQVKKISVHLMQSMRKLYGIYSYMILSHFAPTSELFNAFVCGTIAMNVQKRYQQSVFLRPSGGKFESLILISNQQSDMNLQTPILLALVDDEPHFKATIDYLMAPDEKLMLSFPMTKSKLAVYTVANFNQLNNNHAIASKLLSMNQPLLSKLANNMNELCNVWGHEDLKSFLTGEVQTLFGQLNSRDFRQVSNHILGQVLSLPKFGHDAITGRYVFEYDIVLRHHVKTFVLTTKTIALAVNVFDNKDISSPVNNLWISNNRRLECRSCRNVVQQSHVWKYKMIHVNIDVKTGEVQFPGRGEPYKSRTDGHILELYHFVPGNFVINANRMTENTRGVPKVTAPLGAYLRTSDEIKALLLGLFSGEYSCIISKGVNDRLMISLLKIDGNTVIDQKKFVSDLHRQLEENFMEELQVRINILSNVYNHELLFTLPSTVSRVDVIPPPEQHTVNELVENRVSLAGVTGASHENSCFLRRARHKRSSFFRWCLLEIDQMRNDPSEQVNVWNSWNQEKKSSSHHVLTANQMKLIQHVFSLHATPFLSYIDKTRLLHHLNSIHIVSNAVTLGILYKNIAADISRGDYAGAISGAAFLGLSYTVPKAVTYLADEEILRDCKFFRFMSPALKTSAPFLRRFAAGYNLYSLYKSASSYSKTGDTTSLINVIESSTFLAVDAAEISMEFAGLEILLSFLSPVGAAVTALVLVTAEIYQVHEQIEPYDQILHLSLADKIMDGAYTMFTGEVDPSLRDLAEEKRINEQLATSASNYLSNHPEILAYIFPIYLSMNGRKQLADNNVIQFSRAQEIEWSQLLPDQKKLQIGTEILCFTSEEAEWSNHEDRATRFDHVKYYWNNLWKSVTDEFKTKHLSYRCDKALGLVNPNVKHGKVVIDMKDGVDIVEGYDQYEHLYIIGNGNKSIHSRSEELATFRFVGELTTGYVFGPKNGSAIADFSNYAPSFPGNLKITMINRKMFIQIQNGSRFSMSNVFNVIGRNDRPDYVVASCFMKTFSGNGAGKDDYDVMVIPDKLCLYDLTIIGSDNMKINNRASLGSFKYFLNLDIGSAVINTINSSVSDHEIFFQNWNITGLENIFFETDCLLLVHRVAYCEICAGNLAKLMIRFSDGFSMRISKDRAVHAYGTINSSSDFIVEKFRNISQRLRAIFNIRSLNTNTSILISHNYGNDHIPMILPNDPNSKQSILVSGAKENIFVISSAANLSTLVVVISEPNLHNTIDMSSFSRSSVRYVVDKTVTDFVLTINITSDENETQLCKVTIDNCFVDELYKTFSIILKSPMQIELGENGAVSLIPRPLLIDPSKNPFTIINENDLETGLQIHVNESVEAWSLYRTRGNLICSAFSKSSGGYFWIMFKDFYAINQESTIDFRIISSTSDVALRWDNTRPTAVMALESVLELLDNETE